MGRDYRQKDKRVSTLLGMPIGTAQNRLRKSLMFMLMQKAGLDTCFRCGIKIEAENQMSIDHKDGWQLSRNPAEEFFNLENIAFSHARCNFGAATRPSMACYASGEAADLSNR